ncbi:MAG TPA: hypothetical protein PKM27_00440 [Saprospiraceae bacterium]|nr:hypothetical protein [Saprospiraceae bacterium]HNT19242.1 hypothetical protein [Saprospiraceae bacterium]
MGIDILGFGVCAGVVYFAGKKLSYFGDKLAEFTGLGRAWIGMILMATVTSLPELMSGVSASVLIESADLAVGDILGSCAFNLGILSLLDVFTPKDRPLFTSLSQSHILAASFGMILIVLAGLGLFLEDDLILTPSIGMTSIGFLLVYFFSIRTIYKYQRTFQKPGEQHSAAVGDLNPKQVLWRFSVYALIIVLAALSLPYFADRIAGHTGLADSFVGTLFLAISTSLPEIAVSIAAARMGSLDLAVGNLFGSNLFNIFILFLDDLLYTKGHLLKDASDVNLVSVFFIILMALVSVIGLLFPITRKKIVLAWDTLVIFLLYALNIFLLFRLLH